MLKRPFWILFILAIATLLSISGCSVRDGVTTVRIGIGPGSEAGEIRINPIDGAEMVWVPAGDFLMGSTDDEIARLSKDIPEWMAEWFENEKPRRKVFLDGYWIYKNPVTVAQFRRFCLDTERNHQEIVDWEREDDHPIVWVTWEDAADYAQWAGASLPTEAQWEKTARGANGQIYPWGDNWPPVETVGNFADLSLAFEDPEMVACLEQNGLSVMKDYDDGYPQTSPVGSFPSGVSPYGCLDMAGNVWEWCADWYDENYYRVAPSDNPKGAANGTERVTRGGSWSSLGISSFRSSVRNGVNAMTVSNSVGFRCAINP